MLKMYRRDASGSHESRQSNTSAASRLSAKITSKVKRVVHKFEKLGKKHKTDHQLVKLDTILAYNTEAPLSTLKTEHQIVNPTAILASTTEGPISPLKTKRQLFEPAAILAFTTGEPASPLEPKHQLVEHAAILASTTGEPVSRLESEHQLIERTAILASTTGEPVSRLESEHQLIERTAILASTTEEPVSRLESEHQLIERTAILASTTGEPVSPFEYEYRPIKRADILASITQRPISSLESEYQLDELASSLASTTGEPGSPLDSIHQLVEPAAVLAYDTEAPVIPLNANGPIKVTVFAHDGSADIQTNTSITTDTNTVEPAIVDNETVGIVKRRKTMFSRLARKSIDATAQLKPKLTCRRPSLPKFSMPNFQALIRKFSPTNRRSQFGVLGDGDIRGIYYPETYFENYRRSQESTDELVRQLSSLGVRTRSQLSVEGYIPAPTWERHFSPIDAEAPLHPEWSPTSSPSPSPERLGLLLLAKRIPTPYPKALCSSPGAPSPYTPTASPPQGKSLVVKKRNQRRNIGPPRRSPVDFSLPPPAFRLDEAVRAENEWWQYLDTPIAPFASPTSSSSVLASPPRFPSSWGSPAPSASGWASSPAASDSGWASTAASFASACASPVPSAASASPSPRSPRSPPPDRCAARLSFYEDEGPSSPSPSSDNEDEDDDDDDDVPAWALPAEDEDEISLARLADLLLGAHHPDRQVSDLEEERLQATIRLPVPGRVPRELELAHPQPVSLRVVGEMRALAGWGM